jgi:hypothetical protein
MGVWLGMPEWENIEPETFNAQPPGIQNHRQRKTDLLRAVKNKPSLFLVRGLFLHTVRFEDSL